MLLKGFYIINKETVCLLSEYDERGYECTRVIEGERVFLVKKSVQDVLEESFHYYARNLAGAIVGARSILGDKHFLPVELNVHQGIILAPFHISKSKKKIWIVTSKIIDVQEVSEKLTVLHLMYGHSLNILLPNKQVDSRRSKADKLQIVLQVRYYTSKKIRTLLYEPGSGLTVVEEKGEYNFQVKNKKKEE